MKQLESSLKDLVTRVLEKTAPKAAAEFRKQGDRIVQESLRIPPEALRQKLLETESPPKPAVRTRGGEILLGFEGISIAVTMTSILVHLWHERTLVKLTRQEQTACQRLELVWGELLMKHGFSTEQARQISAEFGEDLQEVFLGEQGGSRSQQDSEPKG
jgi:hypothetical protein